MNKKLKAKWVKALRSGGYRQGAGYLHDFGGYCCLGVLRHIADPNDQRSAPDVQLLSVEQRNSYGGISSKQQQRLAQLNDNGKTFTEIADYIEKYL